MTQPESAQGRKNEQLDGATATRPTGEPSPDTQAEGTKPGEGAVASEVASESAAVDYRKLYEDADHRARSAEGRLAANRAVENRLDGLTTTTRAVQRTQIEQDVDLQSDERLKRLAALDADAERENAASALATHRDTLSGELNDLLAEAGMTAEHPAVVDAVAQWEKATSTTEYSSIYNKLVRVIVGDATAQTAQAVADGAKSLEEARQQVNREDGVMAVGVTTGRSSFSPSEKGIRDAFIADPSNPAVLKAYHEMRQAKGY